MATITLAQPRATRTENVLLWTLQVLLAAMFLFAGVMKLVTPAETLQAQSPLPVAFLQFIGVAEVLGALGLVLPMALRIRPVLTPLAAAGLTIIMAGATVVTLLSPQAAAAPIPLVVGLLTALVAYRRRP